MVSVWQHTWTAKNLISTLLADQDKFTVKPRDFITLGHVSTATGKEEPGLALSCHLALRILFCLQNNTSLCAILHTNLDDSPKKKQYAVDESHEH